MSCILGTTVQYPVRVREFGREVGLTVSSRHKASVTRFQSRHPRNSTLERAPLHIFWSVVCMS